MSVVIDHLEFFAEHVPVVPVAREVVVLLPETFSFVLDPVVALETVHEVVRAALAGVPVIRIDARQTHCLDTCAGSALGAVLLEARDRGAAVEFALPDNEAIRLRLAASGVVRLLSGAGLRDFPKAALVALQPGGRKPEWTDEQRESVTKGDALRIPDRLLTWVQENLGRGVHDSLEKHLTRCFVEAIENAGIHTRSDWWVCSHVERSQGGAPRVHATVFNFGQSLAASFRDTPLDAPSRVQFDRLVAEHERMRGFDETWTRGDLLALFAIQDGSTSRFVREPDGKSLVRERGAGTLSSIKLFQYLFARSPDSSPRVCWVSGTTRILMDGRYGLRESHLPDRELRLDIAFNAANDLRLRPDPTAVTNLGRVFPGTLLTVQFDLCDGFLASMEETQ